MASLGHVKDLPKKDLAVDIENGFEPRYEVIEGKRRNSCRSSGRRQRRWIPSTWRPIPTARARRSAFTCKEELEGKKKDSPKIYRVMFNEITANAIRKAIEKPMMVNVNLLEAQQAHGGCWTGWSVTRFLHSCGTRFGAGFLGRARTDGCAETDR